MNLSLSTGSLRIAGLAVFAGFGIQAGVGQAKALDRVSTDSVRIDNLVDVRFGDMAIPDGLGINDDGGSVLTLIEASRLVGAHASRQSALGEFLLEELLQFGFGGRIAAASGIARRALVSADEDMLFEFRHLSAILLDKNLEPRRTRRSTKEAHCLIPALPSTVWKG
jgi:hypothetical protein